MSSGPGDASEWYWMDMMGRSYGLAEIPAAEMQGFFNDVLLKQIPTLKNDPYGLSGDLAFFATLYGAQFNPAGGMVTVRGAGDGCPVTDTMIR